MAFVVAACLAAASIGLGRYYALYPSITEHRYAPDFSVYWAAAQMDAAHLYDMKAVTAVQAFLHQHGVRPWVNPPSFLPWVAPFGRLPFWWAAAAWAALNFTVLSLTAWRILRWRALVVMLSAGVAMSLDVGQITPILAALIPLAVLSLPTRPVIAGVLFGLVATIKPQAVLVAPVALLVGGYYRSLLVSGLVVLVAVVATSLMLAPDIWLRWLQVVVGFPELVRSLGLDPEFLSPAHQLAEAFGLSAEVALGLRLMLCGLALFSVWWAFRREDPAWRMVAISAGSIACSPYQPTYDLATLAIPAVMILWRRQASPLSWAAAGWSLGFLGPWVVAAMLIAGPLDARYAETSEPELDEPQQEAA